MPQRSSAVRPTNGLYLLPLNAQKLLQDLTLTRNNGSSSKSLNLERVTQRGKHKSSATTTTICCFIFPFNRMAKLTYSFHWRQMMTVDLFLEDCELANRCTHKSQCTPHSWCPWLCCIDFSGLDAFFLCQFSSSFCATPSVLLSNYPHFSVFNSRMVWTSAWRRSSALKRDLVLRLLAFLLARSASVSSSDFRELSSHSEKYAFLRLDIVTPHVTCAPHIGIRTFLKVAVSGHGKLQYI